ncbi:MULTISPECIES: glycosyltransferase family 4 protein [Rhodococcus]|jgi:phosphatidyl-myo-inositol alpha-mannosyltransferase|uniref:glycosyltransferase family 4 protein n=1 Tax=Rhodococcus TaxID=1827 RepID=UPI00064277BE|nr:MULTISPECIES: glycosyltransferase family 4 protein [Rhodococcus]KLN72723.1 GDP-mannose-dependent alpha-(1-2)-phosphatidylinositol mannosyltransferase [Rhodococcus erythropolis]ARE34255.1 alpha-(1-2)-phosphatidylinositol mannosyltransferase [Rhodococcus sp. BH4]MBP1053948.1 glycosyltransferase family 4 protein [Rhodococcus qingshengii]MCX6477797.1 glycosyltransferase family 4 protein [Rhodococcus sp. (in: high G+C Gram-positive bacteria)]MCY4669906.1 glycosyltransferase family 4 protein [Rho
MKIGMICPYSFDVPGGVQAHVVDLAEVLIERGHKVSVLAPSSDDDELPDFVVSAGKAVAIPYNGSVARLSFGPTANNRLRKFIAEGDFDVLHIHEPNAPSLSMLALRIAEGPIVATFHTSTTKSLVLSTFQGVLAPYLEKISGRIAVSELARRWQVESLGSDAVEIPNGVDVAAFAEADMLPGYPREGGTILFLGRYDEPRKGMAVLLGALPELVERHPDLEVIVVGRGDEEKLRKEAGKYFKHLRLLGQVSDEEKASALRSVDVYCAPNLGGESFGIVLVEAMAAGTAVVASELDAFRRVLRDGQAGLLVPIGNSDALAEAIDSVLGDPDRRRALVNTATSVVAEYDWPVVAEQILRVYETVTVGGTGVRVVGS